MRKALYFTGRGWDTDIIADLNHTHWPSFTSQPQAFEILHTLASSVIEGKQEEEWVISLNKVRLSSVSQKCDT